MVNAFTFFAIFSIPVLTAAGFDRSLRYFREAKDFGHK
jgi:hypothetical protein